MADNNKPIIAAILSFLITGLGHVYLGKVKKGIVLFLAALVGSFLFLIPGVLVWAFGVYEAYMEAKGKPVWKFE